LVSDKFFNAGCCLDARQTSLTAPCRLNRFTGLLWDSIQLPSFKWTLALHYLYVGTKSVKELNVVVEFMIVSRLAKVVLVCWYI